VQHHEATGKYRPAGGLDHGRKLDGKMDGWMHACKTKTKDWINPEYDQRCCGNATQRKNFSTPVLR